MDITQIETLIAQITTALGYTPLIASEAGVSGSIKALPTAWIQLPKVLYVEGRDEGIIGHQITLTLIDDYRAFGFDKQSERLATMQEDALETMTRLSLCEGVVEVSEVTITPRVVPTTSHDNISQICTATVVSYF